MSFGFSNHNLTLRECLYSFCIILLLLLTFSLFFPYLIVVNTLKTESIFIQADILSPLIDCPCVGKESLEKVTLGNQSAPPDPYTLFPIAWSQMTSSLWSQEFPRLHIHDQFIIWWNCEIQQSSSFHLLLNHSALQEPPILLELFHVFLL